MMDLDVLLPEYQVHFSHASTPNKTIDDEASIVGIFSHDLVRKEPRIANRIPAMTSGFIILFHIEVIVPQARLIPHRFVLR